MKESQRLANEYKKLFSGASWIDVNIMDTISPLTAEQAAVKPFPNTNSIWQIMNHLVNWRETILKRIRGERIPSPENNFFEPVTDTSEDAWKETLQRFETSQQTWINTLNSFDDEELSVMILPGNQSRYELIAGILQHDCYHLGQIV